MFNTSQILKDKGYTNVGDNTIRTFYQLEILDVYKGEVEIGDMIEVQVDGGIFNGILNDNDYSEELTNDFSYILFLNKSDYEGMPYYTNMYQGYLPFKDNKLSFSKKNVVNTLFNNNDSEEQIINKIKDNIETKEELDKIKAENELKAVKNYNIP